jgi:DNA-binding response OmpR family regulator
MRRTVTWQNGRVVLRHAEARQLTALVDGRGCVVRRSRLVEVLWGDRDDGGPYDADGAVSVHIHYLRRALSGAGFPGVIRTEPRVGYELVLQAA